MKRSNLTSALLAELFSESKGKPLAERLALLAKDEPVVAKFANAPVKASLHWLSSPLTPDEGELARAILTSIPRLAQLTASEVFKLVHKTLPGCPQHINVFGRYLSGVARGDSGLIAHSHMTGGIRYYLFDHYVAEKLIYPQPE